MKAKRRFPNLEPGGKPPPWKAGRYRVTLGVADLVRSVTFYRDVLRFWPVWRNATAVCLAQENLELILERSSRPKKVTPGFHLGFSVGQSSEVDQWANYLESCRVPIKAPPKETDCGRNLAASLCQRLL